MKKFLTVLALIIVAGLFVAPWAAKARAPLTAPWAKQMTINVGERFVYSVYPTSVRITGRYSAVVWFDEWLTRKDYTWSIATGEDTYTVEGRAFIRPSGSGYYVWSNEW